MLGLYLLHLKATGDWLDSMTAEPHGTAFRRMWSPGAPLQQYALYLAHALRSPGAENPWVAVIDPGDCFETCSECGEPLCPQCGGHYATCPCPGPHQDDLYDYKSSAGILHARLKVH